MKSNILRKGDIVKDGSDVYFVVESSTHTHATVRRIEHGKILYTTHVIRVAKSKVELMNKTSVRINREEIQKFPPFGRPVDYKHALTKQWDAIARKDIDVICIFCVETQEYLYYKLGSVSKCFTTNKDGSRNLYVKLSGLTRI